MQTTFYLKYRPQRFCDLDSTDARIELIKIFSLKNLPHAFLFSGPKGIGKTSAARIVAKAVNCEERQTANSKWQTAVSNKLSAESFEPCNKCDNCRSITSGTNVDVIEIDAASNRGIDDIKELREKIKLSPATLKYKVYIIDEAHMLTTEAFNALLKTLEEPPKHAIFILCTTDTEKLPKTIVSRCQRINFKRATKSEIVSRLKKICELEGLAYEEKALEEIVKLSEGSFRDATKILEQVSYSGKIELLEVEKVAGILSDYDPEILLSFLQEGKTKEALLWINSATDLGINLKVLIESLSEKLRNCLLKSYGIKQEGEVDLNFTSEECRKLLQIFSKAYNELKFAVIPQLPLEMAVVEWGEISERELEDGGEKLEKEVRGGKEEKPEDQKDQGVTLRAAGIAFSPARSLAMAEHGGDARHNSSSHFSPPTSVSLEAVVSKWPEILEKVKPMNHSVQAFLRACRPISMDNGFLTLEVFYKFHKEQLETEKCRKIFECAAGEVLACSVRLKCTLGEKKQKVTQGEILPAQNEPQVIKSSPILPEADIMKIAEEIFNGGNIQ